MTFKRTGTPENLEVLSYKADKETAIICPDCHSILGYKSGGLVKNGSAVFLGTHKVVCTKCDKEVAL